LAKNKFVQITRIEITQHIEKLAKYIMVTIDGAVNKCGKPNLQERDQCYARVYGLSDGGSRIDPSLTCPRFPQRYLYQYNT